MTPFTSIIKRKAYALAALVALTCVIIFDDYKEFYGPK